jgi:hypothetical protein
MATDGPEYGRGTCVRAVVGYYCINYRKFRLNCNSFFFKSVGTVGSKKWYTSSGEWENI